MVSTLIPSFARRERISDKTPVTSSRVNASVAILPVEELSQAGRPLSVGDGAVKKLYEQRNPIYEALADYIIDVGSSPEETANSVLKKIKL